MRLAWAIDLMQIIDLQLAMTVIRPNILKAVGKVIIHLAVQRLGRKAQPKIYLMIEQKIKKSRDFVF